MKKDKVLIDDIEMDVYSLNTVIVGSGAAGFNAADSLYSLGQKDIAIVTEGLKMGTSRNTGSDKQTYYKLTTSGDGADSVLEMAETLYAGGCMNGDIALVEAALSTRMFYKLAEIGVPFPHNRYGEYVGYKTDHDPRQRATSAGPLTSRFMTERLEQQVIQKGIRIFDGYQVIGILVDNNTEETGKKAVGLIALNLSEVNNTNFGFTLFNCTNIVYATGGPAGMYLTSVYPESQTGASGIAYEAGVRGVNLTESQYGIASIKFRWNLSGTYQQVIPRYVSTNHDGTDEREFLNEYFKCPGKMMDAIFLKGYQWPFDPRKIENYGSSIIDILVYNESQIRGRKVFLDYTQNPSYGSTQGKIDFSLMGAEAYGYLERSNALFGTPIERLRKMNEPAIDLYKNNGIDLEKEYLEIDVCAQHNNGGLIGNIWWESNVRHFFPVGEVNGTFGVYRPGGSALNSTQVGSLRAAQFIHANYGSTPIGADEFISVVSGQLQEKIIFARNLHKNKSSSSNVVEMRRTAQKRMSRNGAHIRSLDAVGKSIDECMEDLKSITSRMYIASSYELPYAFQNYDILISQLLYLNAIREYIKEGGGSRGSYLVTDSKGSIPVEGLNEGFRFRLDNGEHTDKVCEVFMNKNFSCVFDWKPVRPIPVEDNWFESVWSDFRNSKVII